MQTKPAPGESQDRMRMLTARLHAGMGVMMSGEKFEPGGELIASHDNSGGKEPLQVRIPIAVKRRFKARAALLGMEPHELFVKMWDHYEATYTANTAERGT